MSRAHERAYRLLSERVRLADWSRRTLYTIVAASVASGVAWLLVHYLPGLAHGDSDEMRRAAQEAFTLKVHGFAGFAVLFALGAMSSTHMRKAWALQRNRRSGIVLVALFAMLALTGYALYYLVTDESHAPISMVHWMLGLALAPLVVVHVLLGHRTRATVPAARKHRANEALR
ncbi:MAG TPA: DUF4405 domain-containing protein [Casimicrobiaceae bacterium]|nr:DUF4405 domain-containing protein [Casimicrobiaceae bacterium]